MRRMLMSAPATIPPSSDAHRVLLVQELYRRYGRGGTSLRRRFWIKKYAWTITVGGAKLLKRALDIAVSLAMLLALAPLFLAVALCIKLTDRGPVIFRQVSGPMGPRVPLPEVPL